MTTDTIEEVKTATKVALPREYNVIYLNDEKTSFEFVIESLIGFMNHDHDSAEQKAYEIHTEGSAVVLTCSREIGEQKVFEVITAAKKYSYPLDVKLEEA
jgi:ATP-dependent Clp protease adapter protein ClpS